MFKINVKHVNLGVLEVLQVVPAIHDQRAVVPAIVNDRAGDQQLELARGAGQRDGVPGADAVESGEIIGGNDGVATAAGGRKQHRVLSAVKPPSFHVVRLICSGGAHENVRIAMV